MPVAIGTVTINAAFLREIKEDNCRLQQLLAEVRSIALGFRTMHDHMQLFVRLLGDLRDQLAMHFALEEAYGYFEDAVAEAPRLSEKAEALRAEHRDLYVEISRIAEQAEASNYRRRTGRIPANIAHRVVAFDDRLSAHEAMENELILQAFDDDIGVGD